MPTSPTVRHVGIMVARAASYDRELGHTKVMRRLVDGAALQRSFACNASLYYAEWYAGSRFLLVGDAASPWVTHVGLWLIWIAAGLTLITGYDYLRTGLRHMAEDAPPGAAE